jgi:hypothetical protein
MVELTGRWILRQGVEHQALLWGLRPLIPVSVSVEIQKAWRPPEKGDVSTVRVHCCRVWLPTERAHRILKPCTDTPPPPGELNCAH